MTLIKNKVAIVTPWLRRPEDVAGAAPFVASDLATCVTGINLLVDGGWMAGRSSSETFSQRV